MKGLINKKNYYFFIGTNAELLKFMPVLKRFNEYNVKFKIISSGQNNIDCNKSVLKMAGIKSIDIKLTKKPIKQTFFSLFFWFFKTLFIGLTVLKKEFKNIDKKNTYMIVHGDTVSTVMGALIGCLNGIKVAHTEAGYRSFNFTQPFPEEIDRFLVSFMAKVHFCPYGGLIKNINKRKGIKINTYYNTSIDSLNLAINSNVNTDLVKNLKSEIFYIFIMHRQENLFNEEFTREIIQKINNYKDIKCLFVLHELTKTVLDKYNLISSLENNKNIILSERIDYFEFIKILNMSEFLITDGGGNQQECYYLGKPCLLLRKFCEGKEGINRNIILAGYDFYKIDNFMKNYKKYIKERIIPNISPSNIVAEYLIKT